MQMRFAFIRDSLASMVRQMRLGSTAGLAPSPGPLSVELLFAEGAESALGISTAAAGAAARRSKAAPARRTEIECNCMTFLGKICPPWTVFPKADPSGFVKWNAGLAQHGAARWGMSAA